MTDLQNQHVRDIGLSLLILLCLALDLSGRTASPTTASIAWKNLEPTYKNFSAIKPVLANRENRSLFLSRLWPDDSARLERWDEVNGRWEPGDWGTICGLVEHAGVPIEIKSKSERAIHVYWQLSTDDWDHPKYFVVHESLEQRPLRGKYRLILRYAFTPWTIVQHPAQTYVIQSPEFTVEQ